MRTYSSKYFHPRLGDSSQELSWLSTLSTLRGLVGNLEGKCLFRLHVQYAYYNRKKFVFYDNDGNRVGTLDAERYLTESQYDSSARLTHSIRYATQAAANLRAAGTFAQLKTSVGTNSNDQHAYTFYNSKGQIVAVLDAAVGAGGRGGLEVLAALLDRLVDLGGVDHVEAFGVLRPGRSRERENDD